MVYLDEAERIELRKQTGVNSNYDSDLKAAQIGSNIPANTFNGRYASDYRVYLRTLAGSTKISDYDAVSEFLAFKGTNQPRPLTQGLAVFYSTQGFP